jgi:hypothetical protein
MTGTHGGRCSRTISGQNFDERHVILPGKASFSKQCMRKMLFVLLLLPIFTYSQEDQFFGPLLKQRKDSTTRPVSLPSLFKSDLSKIYEIGRKSAYNYVVDRDSVYYRIFSRYPKDSLPVFDFNKQELVVVISCHYCSGNGSFNGVPRHRNACAYRDFWFVREKKPLSGRGD